MIADDPIRDKVIFVTGAGSRSAFGRLVSGTAALPGERVVGSPT